MKLPAALASMGSRLWTRGGIVWTGAAFIAIIVALAAFDIWRSYYMAVDDAGRELETHARIIAEQTARSVQAVDVALRHIATEFRRGRLARLAPEQLHGYLRDQAVGLAQIDGLAMYDAKGDPLAASWLPPGAGASVAQLDSFQAVRDNANVGLVVGPATRSPTDQQWVIPLGRRLESPTGEFAGAIGARGRVDYFQHFYRDIRLESGTRVTLMHRNGLLLARHPPMEAALGSQFPLLAAILAKREAGTPEPTRAISPADGVERFGVARSVPDYPLEVIVTRDVAVALMPWREAAWGTALRTLALAWLAAGLLWLLTRQFARLSRVRESLETSRERFALAVAGSNDGIWDWNHRNGQVFASARARELFGLPPGPDTQTREAWLAEVRFHPDDSPRRLAAMEAHLAGKTRLYEGEYRVQHADGSYRWVLIRGLCVRDASGQPLRMAGSITDIDARRRTEEALRESEERFSRSIAGANDGILDWDILNDRYFVSERAMHLLGLPPGRAERTRDEWLVLMKPRFHPDDRPRLREALRGDPRDPADFHEGEYRVRGADDVYRWMRFRGRTTRNRDGRAIHWSGSVSDVDALKAAEHALRESEQRFQLAIAGVQQGVWDWDLKTDQVFLSARAQELFGHVPKEPVRPRRQWISEWDYHPDDRPRLRRAVSEYLRGATRNFEVEYRMRLANGEWRWFRDRGVALRDHDGLPYRMAGSIEDITDRKRAEAERDRLEGQLRQAQKLEAMGTLAGGIAHDFNNILAAILGYGEMAQKDAAKGTPLRRHLDATMSAAMRAKSLVERILAFSRSGMGERVPVHVQSVVSEVLDTVAGSLPAGVRLERDLAAGDAAVFGDPTQLHQVVMNLCSNAVQAIKSEGTVSVMIDTVTVAEARHVTTCDLPAGRYIRLRVADTGSGIPREVIERIFDPFFTTKEVGVGTGLGLSLVHGIVTDLGGGVDVESQTGAGSTFTVYLPWQSDAAPLPRIEEGVTTGAGQSILLVDDETPLVELGEEMMAELGYEPVGFTSSQRALDAFRAAPQRFDAVLSDEAMPGMTGAELAAEIHKIRPEIPIVLMSGYATPELAARARKAGVVEVLAKPLVSRDVARSLASALRR